MNWSLHAFSNLFEFQKKSKVKAGDGLETGAYPFYTSSAILSKFRSEYLFKGPGLILGTGGMASIHHIENEFSASTDCFVTLPKSEKVFSKFVYYYLHGNIYLLENGFKGAGLKHLSKNYLSNLKIPLPPLETQQKIATILDKADELVQNDKKILEKYDQLAQSVFLEMFGKSNPEFNKRKEIVIQELALQEKGSMRTGPFGSDLLHSEFVEEGIAVLGIDNAVENKFSWKGRRFITTDKYQKLKRYTIKPNDVIITIMGTLGRSAVVPEDIGLAINTKHLAAITLNKKTCNPYYLSFALHSDPFLQFQLKMRERGAIMAGLNLTIIKNLKIKYPPIELQNRFAEIIKHIETQKQVARQSLQKSEELFLSLLQGVFRASDGNEGEGWD